MTAAPMKEASRLSGTKTKVQRCSKLRPPEHLLTGGNRCPRPAIKRTDAAVPAAADAPGASAAPGSSALGHILVVGLLLVVVLVALGELEVAEVAVDLDLLLRLVDHVRHVHRQARADEVRGSFEGPIRPTSRDRIRQGRVWGRGRFV